MMYSIIDYISIIYSVYFTNFPYVLYNSANNIGNMAYCGVASGFIHSQKIFWSSNMLIIIILCNDILNIYFKYILFLFSIYLYIISFLKILENMKYLQYLK